MDGCELPFSLPHHHDYSFQVYPSVSTSPCNAAGIYSATGSAAVGANNGEWDALSHSVQIFGQLPGYADPTAAQQQLQQPHHQQQFYLQQQQQHQYVPTCSTPLSVTSSGSDIELFSPADGGGEPLPFTTTSYSDARSPPQAAGRKAFSHHSTKPHRARLPYCGRRRTPPVFPDNSIPIAQLHDRCANASRNRTPSENCAEQRLSDVALEFVKLSGVLDSAATSASHAPMMVGLSRDASRQLEKIENGLLKLQAEKARLVKQARETLQMVTPGPACSDASPLAVSRTGRLDLDTPHLDEANYLLSAIGGLHKELHTSVRNLFSSMCPQRQTTTTPSMFSECLSYLRDHLAPNNSHLKLHQCPRNGLYQVESSFSAQQEEDEPLTKHLHSLNQVLKYAQFITVSNTVVKEHLAALHATARQRFSSVEVLYTTLEREQVKCVLEGNCMILSFAEEAWQQEHHMASDIIKSVTQCLIQT